MRDDFDAIVASRDDGRAEQSHFFFDDDDDDDDDDGLLLFQIEQKAYGYQTLDQLYVSGTTEKLEINLLHIIIISLSMTETL